MMTEGIYLLLGSNMGDKRSQLTMACALVSQKCTIQKQSSIYETAAWGKADQPSFYNQIIQVTTDLSPEELLSFLLDAELQMGRERKEKWGQRIIDIDILYYYKEIINSGKLTIPHPEIQNRRFTLVPLVEIAENLLHPIFNKTQGELLQDCEDSLEVVKI